MHNSLDKFFWFSIKLLLNSDELAAKSFSVAITFSATGGWTNLVGLSKLNSELHTGTAGTATRRSLAASSK